MFKHNFVNKFKPNHTLDFQCILCNQYNKNFLITPNPQIYNKKIYFFLVKNIFTKTKLTVNNYSTLYKFIYTWFTLLWMNYSKNMYCMIRLYHPCNLDTVLKKYNVVRVYNKIKPRSFKLFNQLLNIFHNVVKFKNLNFFQSFIKRFFKAINFYKHKFLIFYIRKCIKLLNISLFNIYGVNGLYLRLHGKIAKAGNSRKQKMLITYNNMTTNHTNTYFIDKFQIHTFTGTVGCTILLSTN